MGAINGTAVTAHRRAAGWTIAEMAKRVDISPGYLSRIESGERKNPSVHLILAMAHTLGVGFREITYPVELAVAS